MKVKKHVKEEGEHEVNITITIAKASPTADKDPERKPDAIHVENYFHCEYKVLPDDKDFVRTDVVTFGDAAKLYADNDSKVLRVWSEGSNTWVAWSNSRRIRVTQDVLLKMFEHKCELRFWDMKDKVSAKARFDRPKAFRLPPTKAPDEVDLEVVRSLLLLEGKTNKCLGLGSVLDEEGNKSRHHGAGIISQSTIEEELSNQSALKKVSFEKRTGLSVQSSTSNQFVSTTDSKLEVKVRLDKNKQPEFKNLMSLATTGPRPLPVDTEDHEQYTEEHNSDRQVTSNRSKKKPKGKSAKDDLYLSLLGKDYVSEADKIFQNGLASVSIPLKSLFTNCTSLSNNLKESVGSVEEVIVILTLDTPLLSEIQRDALNPMALTVGAATQMPDNGMSFEDLAAKCIPPYIRYTFHNTPEYVSNKLPHRCELKFNQHNVILLGIMSKELLREFLLGPPLKIEIHDRDPKECLKKKAGIFGSQPDDEEISNITFTSSRINSGGYEKSYNITYGIAEFDLSELLKGERILTLVSPIRNFMTSSLDCNNNTPAPAKSKGFGIPPGDYLEFGSELKIKVELSRSLTKKTPLTSHSNVDIGPTSTNLECPFNRMVYIFDYKNKLFLRKIITEINEINAGALDLLSYPAHVIAAALSTYKLTAEQKEDKTLDIITGCQVIDGNYHMFILEGLSNVGVKRLWEKLEHPEFNEDSFFRLLYNSRMSFSQRIYLSLDVDLTRVRLHQPLCNIVRQPLLYVRDILPNPCFQAVTKLFQLTQCTSIHNAIRNEMLPSAEMIISLAKEFGIPLTASDQHDKVDETNYGEGDDGDLTKSVPSNTVQVVRTQKKKLRLPLDMKNEMYEGVLEDRVEMNLQKDFIRSNIQHLLLLSRCRPKQPTISCDSIVVAHNYSTQTCNTTEMAKEKLRQTLAKDGDSRYTYCSAYNSATVVPVSLDKISKEEEEMSKEKWKTNNGFIFPGFKSSLESNAHPRQIDSARNHELHMPWRENILHRNIVKPTVNHISFKWEDRHLDFNTWRSPPEFFGQAAPVTIHTAGDTLENEKQVAKQQEEDKWKARLVVEDPNFHTHRCLIATELTDKGAHSSNQQDRLHDILKDNPHKLPLKKPGMCLSPIPALSVVNYPNVDRRHKLDDGDDDGELHMSERHAGFHPGEMEGLSWLRDVNNIPIKEYNHSHFEKSKGHEFRLVHTDREKVPLKIKPLEPLEKDNHLFLVKS